MSPIAGHTTVNRPALAGWAIGPVGNLPFGWPAPIEPVEPIGFGKCGRFGQLAAILASGGSELLSPGRLAGWGGQPVGPIGVYSRLADWRQPIGAD